jgi:ABC-type branched-subunit amino acid transport system substrate-binding protein
MWDGANAAFLKSPALDRFRGQIELIPFDDGGMSDTAQDIAEKIASDPSIMVVIGHAASSTTRAGEQVYGKQGIPLIMPIATSPTVAYPETKSFSSGARFNNCFRLPPSDDRAQAPAVAHVVLKQLNGHRVFLLRDVSADAAEYSLSLYSEIGRLLDSRVIGRKEVDRAVTNFRSVALEMLTNAPDVIVFCGYGTTAQALLADLNDVYGSTVEKPTIILTDGCKMDDLSVGSIPMLLTFPIAEMNTLNCTTIDGQIVRNTAGSSEQSYQLYGYDAVLFAAAALSECADHRINRTCIRSALASLNGFNGACSSYAFSEGENILAAYYVYSVVTPTQTEPRRFIQKYVITADELAAVRAATRLKH